MIFIKNKTKILFLVLIIISLTTIFNNNKEAHHNSIAVYLDNIESTSLPDRNSNYVIDKVVCDNDAIGTWDYINWGLQISNISKRSNCKLYFRSKKDITITYDNNYIKNDIFDEIYDISKFYVNDIYGTYTQYMSYELINIKTRYMKISNQIGNYKINDNAGIYFGQKSICLTHDTYNIYFEIRGNNTFNVQINSEQTNSPIIEINENWQRINMNFKITSNSPCAFIIYDWVVPSINRVIEIRNISLQEGEYNNYSTTSLKEYDTLSNTLPTLTRDNYTFLGWYTEPIEGKKISSETVVTEDTSYYAHWQYNE